MSRSRIVSGFALAALMAACARGGNSGSVTCGIDALTGPLEIKQSFGRGNLLTELPRAVPPRLPIRLVAGPAWAGTVVDSGGKWQVTTHGALAKEAHVGYGVLVVDFADRPIGVMAFDGRTVRGAPDLGKLMIGDTIVPLLGVRMDPTNIQNGVCPAFPDSLR